MQHTGRIMRFIAPDSITPRINASLNSTRTLNLVKSLSIRGATYKQGLSVCYKTRIGMNN